MESNFYSDEFEQLIREKTEQYKMYPSENVWKDVYSSLHTKKRWFIGSMSLLVGGIMLVAGKELLFSSSHAGLAKKQTLAATANNPKTNAESSENKALPAPFTDFQTGHKSQDPAEFQDPQRMAHGTLDINIVDPLTDPAPTPAGTIAVVSTVTPIRADVHPEDFARNDQKPAETYLGFLARTRKENTHDLSYDPDPSVSDMDIDLGSAAVQGMMPGPGLQIPLHTAGYARMANRARMVTDFTIEAGTIDAADTGNVVQRVNWLQEYAMYNMRPASAKNLAYWQFYFAPDINIRMLSGAMYTPPSKSDIGTLPVSLAQTRTGANFLQNLGFEAGGSVLYRIARNLSIKGGLQFNYARFMIDAYAPAGSTGGNTNGSLDSTLIIIPAPGVSTKGNGFAPQILTNEYFQLAAPVGLEYRVWNNDRLAVHVAATVQPTYLLNTTAYLLTPDNSAYIQQSSVFRRWNLDAGAEIYVSYKLASGLLLQAGPEYRYQILSSYTDQYPLRENLSIYGLKIGISKSIR